MEAEVLQTLGQIAGIGGLALGIFLFLFRDIIRKKVFSRLTDEQSYRLLRLIAVLVWSVAIIGVGAWVWTEAPSRQQPSAKVVGSGIANTGEVTVEGDITIEGSPVPGKED